MGVCCVPGIAKSWGFKGRSWFLPSQGTCSPTSCWENSNHPGDCAVGTGKNCFRQRVWEGLVKRWCQTEK